MTNKIRKVQRVITPDDTSDGAGVKLKRSIATRTLDYLDPFLLFDHFGSEDPDDYIAGFPIHPHRGIETVTYMLAGSVQHKDSSGNSGIIRTGDVQWMTAGGGIMHEEMPILEDGHMEGFQLWVNLPARLKMSKPRYQEIASASIPEHNGENGVRIRVIAGKVGEVAGAVSEIAADPTYLDVAIPANTNFKHAIPQGHTAFAYLFQGGARFDDETEVHAPRLVIFADGDEIEVEALSEGARFLLVSGKPLNEPVARYGPFVMNTEEEIQQALSDLRRGTFIQK
jgi:redox-sensitive bicupin YhaK (pirin superfamily)